MIELNKLAEDYIAPEVEILSFKALERLAGGNAGDGFGGGTGFETDSFVTGGDGGDVDEGE